MLTKVNWIKTDQNITVNYTKDGKWETHTLPLTDSLAPKLVDALKARDYDKIPTLVSKAKQIEIASKGRFVVRGGLIYVDDVAAPPALGKKILQFSDEGLPYEPLVAFAKNLQANPSFRSVNQLFSFLEKNDHPITDDGCFIAYKKVRSDFKDCHTGTFDNSPGQTVSMPRNQVNEDPEQTCSNGLHVANYSYAKDFYGGGVMLEIKVNPAHVVAVPTDYNESKMRVCEYHVLGVVDAEVGGALRVTNPTTCCDHEEACDEDEDCDEDCSQCEEEEEEEDYLYEEDKYPFEDELDDE